MSAAFYRCDNDGCETDLRDRPDVHLDPVGLPWSGEPRFCSSTCLTSWAASHPASVRAA